MARRYFLFETGSDRFLEVDNGQVLGRADFPQDNQLDPAHFRITFDEKGAWVEDLGSSTGTHTLEGRLPACQKVLLRLHSQFEAGNQKLILTDQCEHRPSLATGHREYTMIHGNTHLIKLETRTEPVSRGARAEPPLVIKSAESAAPAEPAPQLPRPDRRMAAAGILLAVTVLFLYFSGQRRTDRSGSDLGLRSKQDIVRTHTAIPGFDWEASPVENSSRFLYLRNKAILSTKTTAAALTVSDPVLQRTLAISKSDLNVFFDVSPEFERAADQACSGGGDVRIIPPRSPESLIGSLAGADRELRDRLQEAGAGPLPLSYLSARLATLRFPISEKRVELASSVIDCSDPTGQRGAYSLHRATLFQLLQTQDALRARIHRHLDQILRTVQNKEAQESIKSIHLAAEIKGLQNLYVQLQRYRNWLGTPEAATQGESLPAFSLAAEAISEQLRSLNEELNAQYADGRLVYPSFYAEIPKGALLRDSDLLFLSVY